MLDIVDWFEVEWKLIFADSYDGFIDNLRIKYWPNYKNKSCYYHRFEQKLAEVANKFREWLEDFCEVDPVWVLYVMYYEIEYTCTDISDILSLFWIEWLNEDITRQTRIFLNWKKRQWKMRVILIEN